MITQPYPYTELIPKTHYYFESVGQKGKIVKIVVFTFSEGNLWSLGFGDLGNDGFIDDSVLTNNQDARKVLQTVAKIAIDFLAQNPTEVLQIEPIDNKRKQLYNNIFQRYFQDITIIFNVLGILNGEEEVYTPLKSYSIFKISLKV